MNINRGKGGEGRKKEGGEKTQSLAPTRRGKKALANSTSAKKKKKKRPPYPTRTPFGLGRGRREREKTQKRKKKKKKNFPHEKEKTIRREVSQLQLQRKKRCAASGGRKGKSVPRCFYAPEEEARN